MKETHEGKGVKFFREMRGMKQDTLAFKLGNDWTQKRVSLLEGKEKIEPDILEQVATVLGVAPDAIKNFNEEMAINYINTFNDHSSNQVIGAHHCALNFNPIDKLMEALEENKKLYERLLASEREKIEILKANANRS
ncbi:helix-turn-helix domain-containing protein [Chitinophaga nivalis]|uniref:Helix-turn-helix domain-containing protein n=1 Tax=Chitinophaga nivalis TaxID=2991709 RepID=A0ABT3INF0_9BACT|nr:helix-turn-helix transcriptional regulator [Chitinophaga nivalis]MCW3464835.1 helix-turn-helix domain-containing protein [Chitinophaga nivalis]MCW3485474.1 helix-turn-helix domain-containing protein [Chitinophaga nivalis]